MQQASFRFPHSPRAGAAALPADAAERVAFDIGWDHAHHGLVPPAELLHPGTPVSQGWSAGKAVFGRRTLPARRATRQWLALRLQAWRRGIAFELQQLTANHLAQIDTPFCPVLRCALGGAPGSDSAALIERLNPDAGFAAGNVAVISQAAAAAWQGLDVAQAVRRARELELAGPPASGPDSAAMWRLAVLRSFATPLPFHEAAQLPLAVLPPNRVRLLNAVQGLQALVSSIFLAAGWGSRCRELATLLPAGPLRHDFNLFVGAMAPRVLESGSQPRERQLALEDAWLQPRVYRRWQHLVLSLGEAGTEALLQRLAGSALAGRRTLWHAPEQAVEGWQLPRGGQPLRSVEPIRLVRRDGGHPAVQRLPQPAAGAPAQV